MSILPIPDTSLSDSTGGDEFRVTGTSHAGACYVSVVFMDGYPYRPVSPWLSYSPWDMGDEVDVGEKIGEVTLDLKGKIYTGTPPDFAGTLNVGTEIYRIEG